MSISSILPKYFADDQASRLASRLDTIGDKVVGVVLAGYGLAVFAEVIRSYILA